MHFRAKYGQNRNNKLSWFFYQRFSAKIIRNLLGHQIHENSLTLSTCILLNEACNTLKFCMYSCSNLVLNLTFFSWTQSAIGKEVKSTKDLLMCTKQLCQSLSGIDYTMTLILVLVLLGKSMSINWQYPAPEHISSIFEYLVCKQSLTQANISCRDKLSVVTLVLYTLTAMMTWLQF